MFFVSEAVRSRSPLCSLVVWFKRKASAASNASMLLRLRRGLPRLIVPFLLLIRLSAPDDALHYHANSDDSDEVLLS